MTALLLQNIEELPTSIQEPVSRLAIKLLEILSDNIKAIFVYGSSAGANFNPGVSDINVGVIVERLDLTVMKKVLVLVKAGRRQKIAAPLLLTKEYVLGSLDVFPIEFSEIKQQHKIIFGEDFFAHLNIPLNDVRLLCEQQVKGKLLHLRQAYLEIGTDPKSLKNFIFRAFTDLVPVFRQLVILKGQEPFPLKEDLLRQLADIFALDERAFMAVLQDKHRKVFISAKLVETHLQNFLDQLEVLSRHMDSL